MVVGDDGGCDGGWTEDGVVRCPLTVPQTWGTGFSGLGYGLGLEDPGVTRGNHYQFESLD